jgi:DNA polymerase
MELYGGAYPWVTGMRDFRRANMLSAKINRMIGRVRANGRMPYELKYFGAHTGRDSGSGKINMQNFPREPICGIDLRASIIAPPGKKLVIADLKQIEARVLLYIVKDQAQLALIESGMSPYEAHARQSMGWKGENLKENDPRRYLLAKARVLALGYGAGWRKFHVMAYQPAYLGKEAKNVFSMPVSDEKVSEFVDYLSKYEKDKATIAKWNSGDRQLRTEWVNSWLIVTDFRVRNPLIIALWKHLDQRLRAHVNDTYRIMLPSARVLQYRDVMVSEKDGATAVICQQGKWVRRKLYGGLLTENLVSAIARDVLRDAAIRLTLYGFKIIMRVHDELVIEAPSGAPNFLIKKLMKQTPSWLPNCPIDSSVEEHTRYKK